MEHTCPRCKRSKWSLFYWFGDPAKYFQCWCGYVQRVEGVGIKVGEKTVIDKAIINQEFTLIIHTNKYAGNFEREMCAYCTGILDVHESGGTKERDEFYADLHYDSITNPFEEVVDLRQVETHLLSPVEIWPSPEYADHDTGFAEYNSVAIFFEEEPTQEQIDLIKRRAHAFGKRRGVTVESFQLQTKKTATSTEMKDI